LGAEPADLIRTDQHTAPASHVAQDKVSLGILAAKA
jgi:hypothetical protein